MASAGAPIRSGPLLVRTSPARQDRETRHARRWTPEDVVFWLFLLFLAWVPFWFGSNDPVTWSTNAALCGGLLAVLELVLLLSGQPHPVPLRQVRVPAACFAVLAFWICAQAATLTPAAWHHPLWDMSSELLGEPVPGSISINRDVSGLALLRLLTSIATFWIALQLCRERRRAHLLMKAVAYIGFGYAAYGIVAFYRFPDTILWLEKIYYRESVTSTFINRNTFAAYAGMALVCYLGLITSASARQERHDSMGLRLASLVAQAAGPAGFHIAAAAIVAAALVLTGSRGGVGATMIAVLAFFLSSALGGRDRTRGASVTLFCAVLGIGMMLFVFGNVLAARLSSLGVDADRLAADVITLGSIRDAPVFGFGYGAFADLFSMYRDGSVSSVGVWDKAHNTYLELAAELGLPAMALFMVGVGWMLIRCLRSTLSRGGATTVPLVAVCASLVAGAQSLLDFSLQIQAVALTWVALVGAGLAQSLGQSLKPASRVAVGHGAGWMASSSPPGRTSGRPQQERPSR